MKVDILKESGFCGGVTRALYLLDRAIRENPGKKICLLGPIVHNMKVNDKYREKGVSFIEEKTLDTLSGDEIIVISAHGISNKSKEKLNRFKVIDTTCPYVQKNKQKIENASATGIIFIGKKNHSETKTMTNDNPDILIVENESDLLSFSSYSMGKIFNQTTFNIDKLNKLRKIANEKAPYYDIEDTMCLVSKKMQEELKERDGIHTVLVVVGDKTSSNANSLVEMSPYHPTYFVSGEKEAANLKFRFFDDILIVGSASTPKDELKKVKEIIKAQFKK